eukprot:CAMPEP_0184746902 /NCGR_PEP_ID=MMETSP0315-20130426/9382_1 /TAXON_ID=101924 /ORGANISM="Rhodosorus marinus, Strain UTEX LB 2760" /LENGTH=425 /DNA_ID=CAMNT_0027219651 /DNA_START=573 /DNA_END=1850 /DNA_ORIENTATION=-
MSGLVEASHAARVVGVLYFALAIVVLSQIIRICFYRHNLLSFQSGFLVLTFSWSAIRSCVFLLNYEPTGAFYFFQWLPVSLELATFLLLSMFCAYLVERGDWEKTRIYWQSGILAAVLFSTLLTLFCSMAVSLFDLNVVRRIHILHAGTVFLALSAILLYYSYHLYDHDHFQGPSLLQPAGENVKKYDVANKMVMICTLLIFCFLLRAFSDLAAAFGMMEYGILEGDGLVDAFRSHPFQASLMLIVWELVPALVVITYFWHIPNVPSTFSSLSSRGVAGSLQRLRAKYGSNSVLPSYALRKFNAKEPSAYTAGDENESMPTKEDLADAIHAQDPIKMAPNGGGATSGRLQKDVPSERTRPFPGKLNIPPTERSKISKLADSGRSISSQSSNPPSLSKEVIRQKDTLFLDNPHRYDTDDEGGTPRR